MLHGCWKELLAIFIFYCKHGALSSAPGGGLRLSSGGWLELVKQAGLAVPQKCNELALDQIFIKVARRSAGQPEPSAVSAADASSSGSEEAGHAPAPGESLDFCGFVELLVHCSHARLNPLQVRIDPRRKVVSLPRCLEDTVLKRVLPSCPRDTSPTVRTAILADAALQKMLGQRKSELRALWAEADGGDGRTDSSLGLAGLAALLEAHGALRAVTVPHRSMITGDPRAAKEYISRFGATELHEAFVDACSRLIQKAATVPIAAAGETRLLVERVEGRRHKAARYREPELGYDGFVECLCRCGLAKYAEIPTMSLCDKVAGFLDNLARKRTEEQVVTAATAQATPPMFNAVAESVPLVGESEAQFAHWLACWQRLKLSSLFGFPLWLREVHELLHGNFRQLQMIFSHYCAVDDSNEASATSAQLLGMPEWLVLAGDCRFATPQFTVYDLRDIFQQALGSGVISPSRTKVPPVLSLPAMIEAIVRVAFARANAMGDSDGMPLTLPARVDTLPGCLARLMEQHVLPLAKRDSLLFLPERLADDAEAQALLTKRNKFLMALMGTQAKGDHISLGGILELFRSSGMLRSWRIAQTSEVTGDPATFAVYTLSLSATDVRTAFVNSTSTDRLLRGMRTYKALHEHDPTGRSLWELADPPPVVPTAPHVTAPAEVSVGAESAGLTESDAALESKLALPKKTVTLEFEEYKVCLARCALTIFSGLPAGCMRLSQMVSALLNAIDLSEGLQSAAERFARFHAPPKPPLDSVLPMPSESASTRARWFRVWDRVDLQRVHGYPLWDGEVREVSTAPLESATRICHSDLPLESATRIRHLDPPLESAT